MSAIYEPIGKAREYSPLALNYYKGCSHNCLYCYVPAMFNQYDSNYDHTIVKLRKSISEILKSVESSAKKHRNTNKQVLLNFTSDPYNPLEKDICLTRHVLEILLKYNIPVSILTKSGIAVERDIDLYKKFGDNIIIGQSLTFSTEKDSNKWESGGAMPKDRILSLIKLKSHKIKTWASFEPVIIPEQSLKLLEFVGKEKCVDHVKIGKLNNYKGIDKTIDWTKFLNDAIKICKKYDLDFYIKKDLLYFKNKSLYLSDNETNQDYLALKNSNNQDSLSTCSLGDYMLSTM